MSRILMSVGAAAALVAAACARTSHYEANAFAWNGAVPAGQWVHVRNLTGSISVAAATGTDVQVHASKRWSHRGQDVRFVETATTDGITICALYRSGDTCDAGTYPGHRRGGGGILSSIFRSRSDARVDFVINVPAGVNVDLGSITGPVRAAGTSGSVTAKTINGDIDITSHRGALDLKTINGSVTAALDTLPATGDIEMESINGSITAVLPPQLDGTVEFETVNGRISNPFALTTAGPVNPRKITGTIGTGGSRHVKLSTVNGSVTLLKHA